MRVLVFCPTKDLFGRTLQSIFRLEWEGAIHFLFTRENPYTEARKNVTHNYILGREWFLEHDYDAMLTVESDMVVPADALQRLAAIETDVAYGLYCWRRGMHSWSAHIEVGEEGWAEVPVSQRRGLARTWWGTVREVTGLGFGCTLIRRRVLEAVAFSMDDERVSDSMLARACNVHGWRQVCDLGVVCGHVQREPPMVIWPDVNEGELFRREAV